MIRKYKIRDSLYERGLFFVRKNVLRWQRDRKMLVCSSLKLHVRFDS